MAKVNEAENKRKSSPKQIAAAVGRSFKDMKGEVKKVVWPTKKQIINNTGIVLFFMAISAVIIGGLDTILSLIVNLILKNA
ncbi:MAG TPA: preprotein translocase subunit SecE [Ruminococcaceae bacterium]|nr:preprotein translocase subunit SecE [Oscillospiraceae bacterium]